MIISQYDYQMYQDEIAELRDEMTQLLISMEYQHQTLTEAGFYRWWEEEGRAQRYFACKGRIEQIQNYLAFVQVREEDHPKMRRGGTVSRHYDADDKDKNSGDAL